MKKFLEYGIGVFCWLNALACCATEKFEVLPDLPDPLAAYAQTAEASGVSGKPSAVSLVGGQNIGHEPSLISVIFSLLIVLLLIYITGILYTKLNKFGANTLRKQQSNIAKSQASVISTTALGNNKTLHVIELDGKRMLIGASQSTIQLIKDLGTISKDGQEEEFSHIEIPTIKIPKIEIPKIEIPSIGFSKLATKIHKEFVKMDNKTVTQPTEDVPEEQKCEEQAVEEKSADGIIDSLFTKPESESDYEQEVGKESVENHVVDPDEYALYKKYLG